MPRAQECSTAIRAERAPTFSNPWGLLAITPTSGTGPKTCFCLCVKHPWLPTGVLHCPGHPSSILCGCINFTGKQVNAAWGRCPTACTIYAGLVDKISPAFELRNSGVPVVARSFQLSCMKFRRASPRLYKTKQVTAYH
jgi:hypothetical protein